MAVDWYVDPALNVLRAQLRAKYPGIVIGTIGDNSHKTENPSSDHNPEKDGSVDALDPMIGGTFTKEDCDEVVNALVRSRDFRIRYIIWQRRIIYGNHHDTPWVWMAYNRSDPHTGHAHISRNDIDETNTDAWEMEKETDMNLTDKLSNGMTVNNALVTLLARVPVDMGTWMAKLQEMDKENDADRASMLSDIQAIIAAHVGNDSAFEMSTETTEAMVEKLLNRMAARLGS